MKTIFFSIAVFYFMHALSVYAGNKELIEKGNKEYKSGDYVSAIITYQKMIETGNVSPELYYNTGNAYFKANDNARAILYYERAKRMKPSDEDINFNLKLANSKIIDKIDVLPGLFFVNWWNFAGTLFSHSGWAIVSILAFCLMLGLFLFYLFGNSLSLRKISFFSGIAFMGIFVLSLLFARKQFLLSNNTDEAIIMSPVVNVKSSPDIQATDIFVIHDGTKVKIIDNIGSWYEIKIPSGNKGWIDRAVFETI